MLLKCSVNLVRLGDLSSFCSWTHRMSSAESRCMNSCASNRVICSARSTDLKCSREGGLPIRFLLIKHLTKVCQKPSK